jgi:hypothetical protein
VAGALPGGGGTGGGGGGGGWGSSTSDICHKENPDTDHSMRVS